MSQNRQLIWADEFNGITLDTTKWSFQLGTGEAYGLQGWGNNEKQYYTDRKDNITLEKGLLRIIAQEEFLGMNDFTSVRIRTLHKGDWTYGKIEARIKLPSGKGIWPAFWMLPSENKYGGWPQSGEIDIMECVAHEPQTIHGTIHYGAVMPNNKHTGKSFSLEQSTFADDFHLFAIEWSPKKISWYVDHKLYFTARAKDIAPAAWPFDQAFHLILNLAVGGNWPGSPDATTSFPQEMVVDYVRVYQ